MSSHLLGRRSISCQRFVIKKLEWVVKIGQCEPRIIIARVSWLGFGTYFVQDTVGPQIVTFLGSVVDDHPRYFIAVTQVTHIRRKQTKLEVLDALATRAIVQIVVEWFDGHFYNWAGAGALTAVQYESGVKKFTYCRWITCRFN